MYPRIYDPPLTEAELRQRNEAIIDAYHHIIADILRLLPEYPTPQLRTYIETGTLDGPMPFCHKLLSPMLYVSISADEEETSISFAKNHEVRGYVSDRLFTALTRAIYRWTAREITAVEIEDCLDEYFYYYTDYEEAQRLSRNEDSGYRQTLL